MEFIQQVSTMKACFQTDGKCEGKYSALTPTLTTESPINRAFQANCEGVRVEKGKSFFLELNFSTEKRTSFVVCKMCILQEG